MRALPSTHYDFVRQTRPRMVADAEARAARIAAGRDGGPRDGGPWALSSSEQAALGASGDVESEIGRVVEAEFQAIRRELRSRRGLAREDVEAAMRADGTLDRIASTVFLEYSNVFNFALFGKRTFHFSGDLAARLAETELNVDAALVRPPFRACLFVFDDPVTREALHAMRRALGEAAPEAPPRGPVSVYLNLMPHGEGRRLVLFAAHLDGRAVHMIAKRELLLRDGGRVEDALRTEWGGRRHPYGGDAVFFGPGLRFVRIVVNAILYLASASPDVSGPLRASDRIEAPSPGANSKERRRHADRLARASSLDYVEVGASLPPLDRDAEPEPTGRVLARRFMVRGHWRWQAHGPGMGQRRLIFVEPFWKGPDMAEAVERPYLVR